MRNGLGEYGRQAGFSVVELMIALAIIGVLSGIALSTYSRHTTKAVVSGEVYMVLSPWLRDCRQRQHNESVCYPCFGISHHMSFEPGRKTSECHVEVKRSGPNVDVGEWVSVRVNSRGTILFEGPLANYMD